MTTDNISEIGIDELGRLYIVPKVRTFPYIYREAMGVHWDDEKKFLYSPAPKEWTYLDWFKQIISAVEAQSCELKVVEETAWVNIDSILREEIEDWSK